MQSPVNSQTFEAPAGVPRVVGVIPSRWGSTRFPGKSLAPIAGVPLVLRVIRRVRLATTLSDVIVATDDPRIAEVVRADGATAVLTRPDHPSGTDRIAEAVRALPVPPDIVVNIQGDEPLIDPALVDAVAQALANPAAFDMATAATPIASADELHRPDVVKVVTDDDGAALYFSRAPIPFVRGAPADFPPVPGRHWRHVGLYAYTRAALERMVAAPPAPLEQLEKLEQLRALALGMRIKVIPTNHSGAGVDSPDDIPRVEALLREQGIE